MHETSDTQVEADAAGSETDRSRQGNATPQVRKATSARSSLHQRLFVVTPLRLIMALLAAALMVGLAVVVTKAALTDDVNRREVFTVTSITPQTWLDDNTSEITTDQDMMPTDGPIIIDNDILRDGGVHVGDTVMAGYNDADFVYMTVVDDVARQVEYITQYEYVESTPPYYASGVKGGPLYNSFGYYVGDGMPDCFDTFDTPEGVCSGPNG